MSGDGKTYNIATVADFLLVPDDRLDLCLREFAMMLRMTRAADDLVNEVLREILRSEGSLHADNQRLALVQLVPSFEWTDDDLGNVQLTILTSDEPTAVTPDQRRSHESDTAGGFSQRGEGR